VIDILPVANPGNTQPPGKPRHRAKITLLVLALLVSAGWIVLGSPGTWLTLILLLAAALSVGSLAAIFLPRDLTPAQKNFVGAAVGCATLLIAYLALPGVRPSGEIQAGSGAETTAQTSPSTSPRPSEGEPFTWDLDLTRLDGCEMKRPFSPSCPTRHASTICLNRRNEKLITGPNEAAGRKASVAGRVYLGRCVKVLYPVIDS
jgi:hypothetical protein